MFNNIALDVVIGLIFIFLLYSLLATIIQEIIATQLAFRAKVLEKAILRMLEDGKTTSRWPILDRIRGFGQMVVTVNRLKDKKFAAAFYVHPLIKYLAEDNWHSKPDYLQASNFSKIVVDLLHGIDQEIGPHSMSKIRESIAKAQIIIPMIPENKKDKAHPACKALMKQTNTTGQNSVTKDINPETQLFLQSLVYEAQGDLAQFKHKLEVWYDDTMERASGWYKRYTQVILFGIGLIIAIIFNVDTIAITKKLSHNPKLREQIVLSANTLLEKEQQLGSRLQMMENNRQTNTDAYITTKTSYDSLQNRLTPLVSTARNMITEEVADANKIMGLGWKQTATHATFQGLHLDGFLCFRCNNIGALNVFGWLLTALAISLGSPFWFDLLNKMMQLRTSGTKIKAGSNAHPAPTAAQPVIVHVNNKTTESSSAIIQPQPPVLKKQKIHQTISPP